MAYYSEEFDLYIIESEKDKEDLFNIETMLNNNWLKVEEGIVTINEDINIKLDTKLEEFDEEVVIEVGDDKDITSINDALQLLSKFSPNMGLENGAVINLTDNFVFRETVEIHNKDFSWVTINSGKVIDVEYGPVKDSEIGFGLTRPMFKLTNSKSPTINFLMEMTEISWTDNYINPSFTGYQLIGSEMVFAPNSGFVFDLSLFINDADLFICDRSKVFSEGVVFNVEVTEVKIQVENSSEVHLMSPTVLSTELIDNNIFNVMISNGNYIFN